MEMKDREGWPLHEGARCERFSKSGIRLSEQVMVIGFGEDPRYPQGVVHVEGINAGGEGTTLPERLRVLSTPEGDKAPEKVKRYLARKRDVELLAGRIERKKLARRKPKLIKARRRRVVSPR